LCALIEWGTFYLLLGRIDVGWGAFIAFLVATAANCALSRFVAFRSIRRPWQEAGLVFGASAIAFSFNFATFIFMYRLHYPPMVAKVCGTGVAFILNYSLRQFFIFSRTPRFQSLSRLVRADLPAAHSKDARGRN